MRVKRIGNHELQLPERKTVGSAGYDLQSATTTELHPGEQARIPTGFAWEIPDGWAGKIFDRSGMAVKFRVATRAGVIDSDYRGEVVVVMTNESNKIINIEDGQRFAQMLIIKVFRDEISEVEEFDSITDRAENGFGSTGH